MEKQLKETKEEKQNHLDHLGSPKLPSNLPPNLLPPSFILFI